MLQQWLAFCHCSLESKIAIIWLSWIKEGHAFDVRLFLYSVTLHYYYLFGNMVRRWKIGILWYATETMTRSTDWTWRFAWSSFANSCFRSSSVLVEAASDAAFKETLKCEPKQQQKGGRYVCCNREMRMNQLRTQFICRAPYAKQ